MHVGRTRLERDNEYDENDVVKCCLALYEEAYFDTRQANAHLEWAIHEHKQTRQ